MLEGHWQQQCFIICGRIPFPPLIYVFMGEGCLRELNLPSIYCTPGTGWKLSKYCPSHNLAEEGSI